MATASLLSATFLVLAHRVSVEIKGSRAMNL